MADCRKCSDFDWCLENEDCGLFKPKQMTNADRIRAMTDEELAYFLERVADGCDSCPMLEECIYLEGEFSQENVRLIWLKKEAET